MRILICTTQVPFVRGGTETLTEGLCTALRTAGHAAEVVALPFQWSPRANILRGALAWRLLDLEAVDGVPIDMVIATKFPSYAVRHPRKVVWLVHQHRQAYDWYGTALSDWGAQADDQAARARLMRLDRRTLGEAQGLYAISRNVANRLRQYNGLQATTLYPPSHLAPLLHTGPYGDYLLSAARLDRAKRIDLLLYALAQADSSLHVIISGDGPERRQLEALAQQLGLRERVHFAGYVNDQELVELYAGCRGVFYAPVDEDYGLATVEAFAAAKPVLTTTDAGGVLEFVVDGVSGLVVAPAARVLANSIASLTAERATALGHNNPQRVATLSWERVLAALLN
ncbi:MAG: glycosyltransferase family 4 protein [Herpetosiphonaceae bacterium]|nr:glycosyltransferase family 4 protein [Herpetosiphonaceae bacterium]